jgi:hypothetical protein
MPRIGGYPTLPYLHRTFSTARHTARHSAPHGPIRSPTRGPTGGRPLAPTDSPPDN